MEILTTVQATSLVAEVVSYLTANWAGLLIVIGFGIGLKLFRSLFNRGTHGRV